MELQSFTYRISLKLQVPNNEIFQEQLPKISDVNAVSREFSNYVECVESCKGFLNDVAAELNKKGDVYKIGSEVNPLFSGGQPSISTDWDIGEVARLWVYDREAEKRNQIVAVGQGRIFGSTRAPNRLPN
jgi:hypothetical protein